MRWKVSTIVVGFLLIMSLLTREPSRQVKAQATGIRTTWIANFRTATDQLITASQQIVALDQEYVANNYAGTLVSGDFSGSSAGLAVADMTTAEGNAINIAQGVLGVGSFPKSIASGTNSTLFKITAK